MGPPWHCLYHETAVGWGQLLSAQFLSSGKIPCMSCDNVASIMLGTLRKNGYAFVMSWFSMGVVCALHDGCWLLHKMLGQYPVGRGLVLEQCCGHFGVRVERRLQEYR